MNRVWARATLVLGLATLALLIAFSFLPSVRAAYPHGDFAGAMSAFQRAQTSADLAQVFGNPAIEARVTAMQHANTLDLFAFIPIYGLFLICGAAMLAGGVRKPLAWLSILPALAGLAGDIAETNIQLSITASMAHADALLPVAPYAWIKYFGLALSALGASAICIAGPQRRFILAALGMAPLIVTFADWLGVIHAPSLLSVGFAVFWLPLLVVAVREAFANPPRAQDASP